MAEIEPLLEIRSADQEKLSEVEEPRSTVPLRKTARLASLDVFRGLCVFLMMLVDYAGSIFPVIAHVPWNGLHLADFVMPFFLFVAGVSVAIVYKKVSNRVEATWKVVLRALKLFLLGVFLQDKIKGLPCYRWISSWYYFFNIWSGHRKDKNIWHLTEDSNRICCSTV